MMNDSFPLPSSTRSWSVLLLLGAVLLLLGPVGCATSPPPPPEPPLEPMSVRGAFVSYPTGMRLLVNEVPTASQVSMTVSYLVGALDEPAGKEGLAYLAAQLIFSARHQQSQSLSIQQQLEAEGAQLRPSFTHDSSDFILTVPPERLARVLSLEARRMRDPLGQLSEVEFLQKRSSLAESLRQEDVPGGIMTWWLFERLLPGHPYGRMPLGTPESLERLTLEDVRAFVKQHYTPAHAVVVLSGPVSLADAKFEVARAFPGPSSTEATEPVAVVQRSAPSFPQELPAGTPMARVEGPVQHPRLYMAWTLPGFAAGKFLHSDIARGVFQGLLRGVFKGDARVVQSDVTAHVTDGMMFLLGWVEVREARALQPVMEQALGRLAVLLDSSVIGGMRQELAAKGNDIVQQLVEDIPTDQMAMFLRTTGRPDHLNALREQFRALAASDEELPGYLRTYLSRERVRLMLVSPRPPGWNEALARALEHSRRASTFLAASENEQGTASLEQAAAAYRSALSVLPRQHAPLQWAGTHQRLGDTLVMLASRQPGTAHLEAAEAAYRASLEELKRERVPVEWALAQSRLGTTLSELGKRNEDPARLEQAVVALRAVLELEPQGLKQPLRWWAALYNNLGTALLQLGNHKRNAAMICEARSRYAQAQSNAQGHDVALASMSERGFEAGTKLLRLHFGERGLRDCMKKDASR
jgi:tetratricopeptide (TPR) repeat protein